MNKTKKDFFKTTASFLMMVSLCLISDAANAARVAIRPNANVARRSPTTTTSTTATNTATSETVVEEIEYEPEIEVLENKASKFDDVLSDMNDGATDSGTSDFATQIRRQRDAANARDSAATVKTNQTSAMRNGKNICDMGLRECMMKECGDDFTKCALDGDTIFGEKLNRCRRQTTCSGEEFKLFTTEIKADRDTNVNLASYTSVTNCGNRYNKCIMEQCGTYFDKCLGKTAADTAIKKCDSIARGCMEQDSGLASRIGEVIGKLREYAEIDVKKDEQYLYTLREKMANVCTGLGAMFDERSFDCVYTVNFFAGDDQTHPMASRKLYAGDTFVCNQEWFGTNVTTFKENAYRQTRAQTAASSAMFGAGVGTLLGQVTSGAIGRNIDLHDSKKALKEECAAQGKEFKDDKCVDKDTNKNTKSNDIEKNENSYDGKTTADTGNRTTVKNTFKTTDGSLEGVADERLGLTQEREKFKTTVDSTKSFSERTKDFNASNLQIKTDNKIGKAWGNATVTKSSNVSEKSSSNHTNSSGTKGM